MMHWNWKKLLIPPSIILLFFVSWLSPLFRPYWNALDSWVFYSLNPWVQTHAFWQHFWAFSGTRAMDWIHDGFMFLFFFWSIKRATSALKKRKIAEMVLTILVMAFTICLVNGILFPEFIHVSRKSPTMVDKTAFRLSSVIDWTTVKDHSRKSFPGDHATTAVLFVSFIFHLMGYRMGLVAIFYGIFFCLPRLILGAHWLTDIVLGSMLIGVTMTSLVMGSPLGPFIIQLVEKWLQKTTKPLENTKGFVKEKRGDG